MTDKNLELQIIDWYSDNYDKRDNLTATDDGSDNEMDNDSDEEEIVEEDETNSNEDDDEPNPSTSISYTDSSEYKIYIFAKDTNENTYCLEVNSFTPYFYIRVPDFCGEKHRKIIEEWVREHMWSKYKNNLLRSSLIEKHSFRNFDNFKKYRFIRLVFSNTSSMQHAIALFQNKEIKGAHKTIVRTPKSILINGITKTPIIYDLYENMIDPILKFIHHQDIKPVGWIKILKGKYQMARKTSRCNYDISVRWNDIKSLDETNNSKIKIMAYDIECDSAHGDFPLPIKDYTKLSRDIYARYQKLDTLRQKYISDKNADSKEKANELSKTLDNKLEFTTNMINYALANGNDEHEINKIYIKNNSTVNKKVIKDIATKISLLLNPSKLAILNDRKRENTSNITKITEILNNNFPEVEGDKTIQIAASFIKYGEEQPYRNVMLCVGTCNKLSNAETISFTNEADLLMKFNKIIIEEDPEIITGYNIDGFDTLWLFKRASQLDIYDEFSNLGRFIKFNSIIKEKQVKGPTGELIKKEYVEIPGRIQMDIMPLIQRNYQLESYKLDNVSGEFINGKIKELIYDAEKDETTIKTDSLKGLNDRNYIIFNEADGYLENKYRDGAKFEIYTIDKPSVSFKVRGKIELDLLKQKCSWCLGKDDTSPQDIFRLQKGTSSDRYIIAKYCMMDVILCIELLSKLELLTNSIGMANVCYNPLSWIIHRGQGVKILSLVAYFIRKKDYLLPYLYKNIYDNEGFEGAAVLDPIPKIYLSNEPISVLDYGSLYPSSMREKNISHETIVNNDLYLGVEGGQRLNELGVDYDDITYDVFKTVYGKTGTVKDKIKTGSRSVRYVQYRNNTKGIIPQILEYLVNARKSTKNKISYKTIITESGQTIIGLYDAVKKIVKTQDGVVNVSNETIISSEYTYSKFQQNVLDGLQLAFKITANSLYGQVGARTSDIYYRELAASTTAVGRDRLLIARDYVENPLNYPQVLSNGETIYLQHKVIYGDTDSVFVKFQCIDGDSVILKDRPARARSIELGIQTDEAIQRTILKAPQVLEYEKTFHPFILFSKKRYVGNLYEHDPDKFSRKSMGIVLKRRDNAPIVKVIFGGVIDIIMKEYDIKAAATYLRKMLIKLTNGNFNMDTLVITKTLSSYYKDPDRIAHRVLADRMTERDSGNKPQVNDRIPYVYIDKSKYKGSTKLLQGDRIETPDFIKANNLKPDYELYINNQIKKPLTQIFALCLDQLDGFHGDLSEYDKFYEAHLASGVLKNTCIKKTLELKRKAAEKLLFGDILRRLENKRTGSNEITSFFSK